MDSDDYEQQYEKYLKSIGYPEKTVTNTYRANQTQHIVKIGLDTVLEFDDISYNENQEQIKQQNQLKQLNDQDLQYENSQSTSTIQISDCLTLSKSFEIIDNQLQDIDCAAKIVNFQLPQGLEIISIQSSSNDNTRVQQLPSREILESHNHQKDDFKLSTQVVELILPIQSILNKKETLISNQEQLGSENEQNIQISSPVDSGKQIDASNLLNTSQETQANQLEDVDEQIFKKRFEDKEGTKVIIQSEELSTNPLQSVLINLFKNIGKDPLTKQKCKQIPTPQIFISKRQQRRDKQKQKQQ